MVRIAAIKLFLAVFGVIWITAHGPDHDHKLFLAVLGMIRITAYGPDRGCKTVFGSLGRDPDHGLWSGSRLQNCFWQFLA